MSFKYSLLLATALVSATGLSHDLYAPKPKGQSESALIKNEKPVIKGQIEKLKGFNTNINMTQGHKDELMDVKNTLNKQVSSRTKKKPAFNTAIEEIDKAGTEAAKTGGAKNAVKKHTDRAINALQNVLQDIQR